MYTEYQTEIKVFKKHQRKQDKTYSFILEQSHDKGIHTAPASPAEELV